MIGLRGAGAVIMVIIAAFCTALCLTLRGPWWGAALDCAGATGCALYAWWLICRVHRDRPQHLPHKQGGVS